MTTRQMMDEWGADRLKLAAAEARVKELEAARGEDTKLLDYLQEEIVDTIYLDDGRIIDVRGDCLRSAIREAMKGGA